MSQKTLKFFLAVISLVVFIFSFNLILKEKWSEIYAKYFPCQRPIVYEITSYDSRFNLSREDFIEALITAEKIWEDAAQKDLFTYKQEESKKNTDIKVNLVYDYRQEATVKIKTLGLIVDDTRHSYDTLRAKYKSLQEANASLKKKYEARSKAFETRQAEYTAKVDFWNKKNGAPEEEFNRLNIELEYLKKEFTELKKLEESINKQVGDINALVVVINRLAGTLNLNASEINTLGKTQGEEFTQGEYKVGPEGKEINIYEFSTKDKLIRLLAHEFGHALGIEHVEDKEAIMYRLNENKNQKLTSEDILALKERCEIE